MIMDHILGTFYDMALGDAVEQSENVYQAAENLHRRTSQPVIITMGQAAYRLLLAVNRITKRHGSDVIHAFFVHDFLLQEIIIL